MPKGIGRILLLLMLVFSAGAGPVEEGPYNVVIVLIDTLRADHLGCYGYARETSPHIDALARRGVLFEWAIAQSSFSLPSHASLFTSRYVHQHQADRIERRLPEEESTLAEVLKENGYATAAFIHNNLQLDPRFGLHQGFDDYVYTDGGDATYAAREPSIAVTLPRALAWIKRHKNKKFFVFLHANDVHEPYESPGAHAFDPDYRGRLDEEYLASANPAFHDNNPGRTPREIQHIIAHYDAGIRYVDMFVGRFIRQMEAWRLLEKTLIIIVADHGEILADRGLRFVHGFSLHDEEVHVPLIIKAPGASGAGLRVGRQVQLIDVFPTVLDVLRIKAGAAAREGRSLRPLLYGREEQGSDLPAYAECLQGESQREGIEKKIWMVRTPSWKLIVNFFHAAYDPARPLPSMVRLYNYADISLPQESDFELYDLKNDPKETKNLAGVDGVEETQASLWSALLQSRGGTGGSHPGAGNDAVLSDELKKKLKAAGYW